MRLLLAEMRVASTYSQTDIARITGVSPKTEWNWENGKSFPNAKQLCALCDLFGTDPNTMVGWYDDHPRDSPPTAFHDARQRRMNDAYERMTDAGKDMAASAVVGMLQSDSARGAEDVQGDVRETA